MREETTDMGAELQARTDTPGKTMEISLIRGKERDEFGDNSKQCQEILQRKQSSG